MKSIQFLKLYSVRNRKKISSKHRVVNINISSSSGDEISREDIFSNIKELLMRMVVRRMSYSLTLLRRLVVQAFHLSSKATHVLHTVSVITVITGGKYWTQL